ncbi:hypothetical protein DM790_22655 [Flavobacterium collinsii]|nr:hypothetical protein [Flavobacterium collinsii]
MNRLIRYFDLASHLRHNLAFEVADEKKFYVIPQYIALLLGIMAQPLFKEYVEKNVIEFNPNFAWIIGSSIISLMAMPAIYKNSIDPTKPLFIQLCVIFTAGIGWQNITTVAQHLTK